MDSSIAQSTEQQQQKQQPSSTHALSSSTSSPQQSSSAQAQTDASAPDAAVAAAQKQQQPSNNVSTNPNTNNDNSNTARSNLNTEQQQQPPPVSAIDKDKASVGSHVAQASRTTTSAGGHQAAPSSEAAHTATLVSNSSPNMSTGGTLSSSVPAATHRASGPASKQSSSAKSKASFLSRLINKLVPCVGPSAAHPIDVDHVQPHTNGADAGVTNGSLPPSSVSLKEKERPTATTPSSAPAKEGEKGGANVAPVPEHQQQQQLSSASGPEPAQTASEPPVADGITTNNGASAPSPPPEAGNIAATGAAAAAAAATNNLPPISIPSSSADAVPLTGDEDVVLPPTPVKQLLPPSETGGLTSGAVQAPGSTGEDGTHHAPHHPQQQGRESDNESDGSYTDDDDVDREEPHEQDEEMGLEDEEEKLISNGGAGIPIGPDGQPRPLLPPLAPHHAGRKCLVLDLDETLVHSSFKAIGNADYVVPVEIEFHWHNVYVIKRPGVDAFLKKMGEIFEIVVFTASLSKYADPVLDKLDIHHVVTHRLFRESCYNHRGNYVKDLSQLGRPIGDTIILDNSPASYLFHPNNAVPVSSWFNDPHDTELTDLCPFLTDLSGVDDVRGILDGGL